MPVDNLEACLRSALCAPLGVMAVPAGYHVETGFMLPDGDPLSFYLVEDDGGLCHFEDDGATLPDAIARGFDIKSPQRELLLRTLLAQEGAHYDSDLAIRSQPLAPGGLGPASLRFISALIRTRDLFIASRENVAASFSDDIRRALALRLPDTLVLDEAPHGDPGAPDIVLRNTSTRTEAARIFAAGGDLRLMDALVEYQASAAAGLPVIAVVDRRKSRVSEKRFNRATNHGLPMAVVDDSGEEWVERVFTLALQRRRGQPIHPH
jgi:hypothetical protein